MIQFNQVTKQYSNGRFALRQVSFCLEKGQMYFLTGHSGAGKSTVLKLIALLEKPSSGTILMNGRNMGRITRTEIPLLRQQIGLILQNPHLLSDRTIFENVICPLDIIGFSRKEGARRVRAALDKVGLLSKEKEKPGTLSAGEQQRVNIARAIVHQPQIILADEPTGNLDPALSRELMGLFEQFHQRGTTLLIASHDLHLIREFNHSIFVLKEGCLIS